MTVGELIELLSKVPTNAIVVLSRDEEGNAFNPLWKTEAGLRFSHETGEIGYIDITPSMRSVGFSEEDMMGPDEGDECVVLWP